METYSTVFERMTATESLFEAWFAFRRGKAQRRDVIEFSRHAERSIFLLQRRLRAGTYRHGPYQTFPLTDPKVRIIRKATVLDRIVHQALYVELTRLYDRRFHAHVYSGRAGKGVHAGVRAVERMTWRASQNYRRGCYYLKCDIRRFYDSVDHNVLMEIVRKTIDDARLLRIIQEVVHSFHTDKASGKGLPIGNVTSQIFTNIYLHAFDMFCAKHVGGKNYARFADDLVIVSDDRAFLTECKDRIESFLRKELLLELHPDKGVLAPLHQGLDFLGYVILPHHRRVRATTLRRVFRKLTDATAGVYSGAVSEMRLERSMQSYLGVLGHANAFLTSQILRAHCFVGSFEPGTSDFAK